MSRGTDEVATTRLFVKAATRATPVTKAQLLKVSALLFLIFGTYVLLRWFDVAQLLNPERIVAHLHAAGPFAPLLGMIVPTFALTYAGSTVVSGEWLLVLLGLVMVALFLLIPKLVVRYPSAWWVRLLRGEAPVMASQQAMPVEPGVETSGAVPRCLSCGRPMG